MIQDNLLLVVFFAIGLIFNNHLIAAATGSLLVIKFAKFEGLLQLLEKRSIDLGLLFLLVAVLAPFAVDKVALKDICLTFQTFRGWVAVLGGVLAAYICGQGLTLMQIRPEIIVGLVIGTVIGVFVLRGTPIGLLAAAGVTAVLLNLLKFIGVGN